MFPLLQRLVINVVLPSSKDGMKFLRSILLLSGCYSIGSRDFANLAYS
jgi:hypothetical protein